MIVTVTPNPSIDRTLRIPPLVRGEVLRAELTAAEAGGKGINVSRALATEGHATVAVAPLSAVSAAAVLELLAGAIRVEPVSIAGDIRVNVSLVEADGTVTKVNEPGPTLDGAETVALLDRVAALGGAAGWVVGCGSLPPGAPDDTYARLARCVSPGTRVAVDADGAPLRACLGERIALIKPNLRELEGAQGRRLPTLGAVVAAARSIVADGIGGVLVSLGPDGAVYVDATGATHAEARIDDIRNNVGAGDALLAGFLAGGADHEALASAVAWSVAACRSPGTQMRSVTNADRDAVVVRGEPAAARTLAA